MRNRRFQNKVTTGRFTLPAALLIATAFWGAAAFLLPEQTAKAETVPWLQVSGLGETERWVRLTISYLLHGLIVFSLINLNNTFSLIRVRASIQSAIYSLLVAVCPMVHDALPGLLGSICFLAGLHFLFSSYRQEKTAGQLFHAFVCIGIACMAVPQYILTVPLLWASASAFYSLNIRSLAGSIIGFALPWWIVAGYLSLTYNLQECFQMMLPDGVFRSWGNGLGLAESVSLAFCFLLFIVGALHSLATGYEDKIRTRSYLYFLVCLGILLFAYVVAQPFLFANFCPLLLSITSILSGHLFALTGNRWSNVFFIFTLIGMPALFMFNLWMLS